MRYLCGFFFPTFGARWITVVEDNEEERQLPINHVRKSNSKHIDVRHHILKEISVPAGD